MTQLFSPATRPRVHEPLPKPVPVSRDPVWERYAQPGLFAVFAVFAAATSVVSHLEPHQVWGRLAAVAYGLGAVVALQPWGRSRRAGVAAGVFVGAVLLPMAVLIADGGAQPEVGVVQHSGAQLLEHGTPYLSPAELAGQSDYEVYNPYLPGMALLGVPWAMAGIDARLVFGAVFLAAMAWAALLMRGRAFPAPLALLAASPLIGLPLAVGGDDLPVIGLACLGLALAVRQRPEAAGVALGAAAALKATAWPVLAVCLVLIAVHAGRWAARRYAGYAAGTLAVGIVPVALADPAGMFVNVVRFPLGLAGVASPADSPLPGRLLADLGPYGHTAALTLLALAAAGMALSLVIRPPADLRAAAYRLALGLLLATALIPASRWGYLVYPAVLAFWGRYAGRADHRESEVRPWLAA